LIGHALLLNKLEIYGVSEISLSWLNSYLKMRKHAVSVNGTTPDFVDIPRGVPLAGSFLGPLF